MTVKRKLRADELHWLKSEEMRRNRITIEWLMREPATVDGDYVVLGDGTKVKWHVEKWPQSFEVVSDGNTYYYRTLDDLKLGIRDIRRNSERRYL